MKIYKVSIGEVINTEVERETKCYYYINDPKFHWGSRIEKSDVCTTPKQAIEREVQKALGEYNLRKRNLEIAENRLNMARALLQKEVNDGCK